MSQDEKKPETAPAADAASGAGAAGGAPADAAALEAELAAAREKAQENWERYLREAAELQNLRKRATEREEKARKFAVDRFAGDLLNVKDSLEMGLEASHVEGTSVEALREGVEATLRQLEQAFAASGLQEVKPEGEPFDPARHEAVAVQELPDVTREQVVAVVQKGYLLHERVLRPARVVVGKPAAAAPAEDGGGADDPAKGVSGDGGDPASGSA
jgi:molecular chaperone GrpE